MNKPKRKYVRKQPIKQETIEIPQEQTEELNIPDLPSKGIGDVVAKVTKFFGIKPCDNCNKRRDKWNKSFPFPILNRELTQEEYDLMKRVNASHTIQSDDVGNLFKLYNDFFGQRVEKCQCPGLIKILIDRLNDGIAYNPED